MLAEPVVLLVGSVWRPPGAHTEAPRGQQRFISNMTSLVSRTTNEHVTFLESGFLHFLL